ncbi:hypothetical protein [Streptomyces fulvoviolaceus]|uniref:hypothetical protein n=1 Tax=Streptomyces fulvoviolaceus TaxID=285535 RepID=UPI00131C5A10|nr:hypothetical protein [Streptomyces fulvoviolaceus]MCT9082210.1 hypothetical protein [Streptomyces fulvoviolaceus]
MAGWTQDHKIAISVALIGAVAVIIGAIIAGLMQLDSGPKVEQEIDGGNGTVCINSKC